MAATEAGSTHVVVVVAAWLIFVLRPVPAALQVRTLNDILDKAWPKLRKVRCHRGSFCWVWGMTAVFQLV